MKVKFAALLATLVAASAVQAASVSGVLTPVSFNNTTSPFVFPDPYDIYTVDVTSDMDFTSASFSFSGAFVNTASTTFADDAAEPIVFGFNAPDTFFVLPEGGAGTQLAVAIIDDSTTLTASYSLPGTTPVVPVGTSTIAFLAVEAGTVPDLGSFSGTVLNSQTGEVTVSFIPEPTAAVLAGLALVGFAARRR